MGTGQRVVDNETSLTMRRSPTQARSRNTVTIIKKATLELLSKEGLSVCSTHRIAQKAGISVGLLYKYFPNRESILKALYDDASLEFAHVVGELTHRIFDLSTIDGMKITMREIINMHQKNQLVLFQLVGDLPELKLDDQPTALRKLVRSNMVAYVQHRKPLLKPWEIKHKCFFIEQLAFSSINAYLIDGPPRMTRKLLADYLGALIVNIIDNPLGAAMDVR